MIARVATALLLLVAMLGSPGIAAAGGGQTPGSYASWSAPENPTSFTIPMTLQVDPGDYNAYWSTQFRFDEVKTGGYFGFQTHRDGGGLFLASVWDATAATAGDDGTFCQVFHEDGAGQTCRFKARPIPGHRYELTVARDDTATDWTFTARDATAGTETRLGTITLAAPATLARGSFISWTEYFDWNNPKTVCSDARYSKLLFGIPHTDHGPGRFTRGWKSKTCQDMSRVRLGPDGATEENGPLP